MVLLELSADGPKAAVTAVAPCGLGGPIHPRPADGLRLPIEIVDLTLEDEETATDAKTGIVRLWVDMTYETDDYKQAVLLTAQVPFEVRLVIRHPQ